MYGIVSNVGLYRHSSISMRSLWYIGKHQAGYTLILYWEQLIASEYMTNTLQDQFTEVYLASSINCKII